MRPPNGSHREST